MMQLLKRAVLPCVVFCTGASILVVEIVAVRVLSPYYGNTIFTVSSVISVILLALSVGYWVGGILADKRPKLEWFFGIIFIGGVASLISYAIGVLLLPWLSALFSIMAGPLVSSALLFLIPALLLGTLSPYAVVLQSAVVPGRGVGSAAGQIFFWSTVGSIAGSLMTGFFLIPTFGVNEILIANSIFLLILGGVPLMVLTKGLKKYYLHGFAVVFLLLVATVVYTKEHTDVLYSKDGLYEKISIYDGTYQGRPTRFFRQDRSSSGAMYLDSTDPLDLVYDYTTYYSLYKIFSPNVREALVIGGGAYSIPKALLHEIPKAHVDVAEIEPSLFSLAKQYFDVRETSRLENHVEDGRRLLRDADKQYDLIFSDVYYSLFSVPAHFTTQEFFTLAKDRLSPDGVFIASMIGDLSRQEPSLMMAEIRTFQSVFPNSYFFAVDSPQGTKSQNIIFVGHNSANKIDLNTIAAQSAHPLIKSLPEKRIDTTRFDLSAYPILTDNFSPVEYLTAQVLQKTFTGRPFIDGNEMLAVVAQQLRYGPRHTTAWGHVQVQEFLVAEMQQMGQEVYKQTWDHSDAAGLTHTLTNIVVRLQPEKEQRIVLGTHYDSKRFANKDPQRGDSPVPGANDSASGVAVLVELAHKLVAVPPDVGVDIVFFDGEEGEEDFETSGAQWKPLGSTYFAEHLDDLYVRTKPQGGIVLDMVCDKDLRIEQEQHSLKYAPKEVAAFWEVAQKIDSRAFAATKGHAISDDHMPLNRAGIPSFLLIDFDYPYFHTTADTLDKCSPKSMEKVAYAVFNYIHTIK